jgi:outer membrane biogenesis lipoprotein LolB
MNVNKIVELVGECSADIRELERQLAVAEWLREQERKALEISARLNKQRSEFEAQHPGNYLTLGDVNTYEGQSESARLSGWTGD